MKATGKTTCVGLRRLASALLTAWALTSTGCLSVLHPVRCPETPEYAACPGLPRCCCSKVHIFFVAGLDPLDYSNLHGLAGHCQRLGFCNTYVGQMYHGKRFRNDMVRIRNEDPDSRFVLVGFSLGANVVRWITHEVGRENIHVDLVAYYGGNTFENEPANRPENAGHVVNVLAHGYIWNGARIDGAENYQVEDVWHFGSPTHPVSLEVFTRELLAIGLRVPMPREDLAGGHTVLKTASRDEWDFLKPDDPLAPLAQVLNSDRNQSPVMEREERTAEPPVPSRTPLRRASRGNAPFTP